MSVKSPLGLVLYCYLNMPTINKTYLILSYLMHTGGYTGSSYGIASMLFLLTINGFDYIQLHKRNNDTIRLLDVSSLSDHCLSCF